MKRWVIRLTCLLLLLTMLVGCGQQSPAVETDWSTAVSEQDIEAILDHYQPDQELAWLEKLTAPEFGGRVACSPDEDEAGLFIADILRELKLEPWTAAGLTGYHHAFSVSGQDALAENIIAVLPGKSSEQFLLLTAHYDHIQGELRQQYPGADDNASGTVALLAAATAMQESGLQPERSIVFVCFSAEEPGLLGSKALLDQLQEAEIADQCVVLNLEMLAGQQGEQLTILDEGKADVNGAFSARAALEIEASGLRAYQYSGASGRVDSMSFTPAGIPAISLFWGNIATDHPFYHTPSDSFATVRADILEQATRAAIRVAWAAANCPEQEANP